MKNLNVLKELQSFVCSNLILEKPISTIVVKVLS